MNSKKRNKAAIWLCIALVLCLVSAIGASIVQTSFGQVNVQDLRVVVDDGYVVNGQIYIPGFGWVQNNGGGGSGTVAEDMYENGNKIGIMD